MFYKFLNYYKKNFVTIFFITFIYSLLNIFFMLKLTPYMAGTDIVSAFGTAFYNVGSIIILQELTRVVFMSVFLGIILNILGGGTPTLPDIKNFFSLALIGRMIILDFFIIIVAIGGMMLLIVPGIIWFVLVCFSYFLLVLNPKTPILEAIIKSISFTKGYRLKIFGLFIVYGFFSFIETINPYLSIIIDLIVIPGFYFFLGLMFFSIKQREL